MTEFRFRLGGAGPNLQFGKDGSRIKENAGALDARNDADNAFVNVRVLDPVGANDAATKQYVDNALLGLKWLSQARVTTTANLPLATGFAAGQVIDGVTLVAGDLILIKDQTNPVENGRYIVQAAGAPVRAPDLAAGSSAANVAMFVSEGLSQADTAWVCTTDAPNDIVGTNGLTFTQFASITAGITSIASVGTGTSIVENGTGPTAELRSLLPDATNTISFAVGTNTVDVGVTAGSIGTTELEDGGVTLAKLGALVTLASFRVTGTFASGSPIAIGTLPANAEVTETRVNVTTAFVGNTGAPTITLGTSGNPTALQAASDNDLEALGTYLVDEPNSTLSGQALIATLDNGGSTVGAFTIDVFYRVIA